MCWQGADARSRLRAASAAWLALLLFGTAWLLSVGDTASVEAMRAVARSVDAHHWIERLSSLGPYFFYGLFVIVFCVGWVRDDGCPKVISVGYLIAQIIGPILAVRILKFLAGRPRPHAVFAGRSGSGWIGPTWDSAFHSFPSGHAADVVTGAIFATLLWRGTWAAVWWALAVLVAMSRIALEQHYPSDVLAGTLLGGIVSLSVLRTWALPRLPAPPLR
jgi:membrane-associated phospholipid phosphatase